MDKFNFIVRNLSKTNRKNYENYVVNSIYSKVNNFDLIPIAQQCVLGKDGHYLIDLFFPQINLAVEVDEFHHSKQVEQDKLRTEDILSSVTTLKEGDIFRVDVNGRSIEDVDVDINKIVAEIKQRIKNVKKLCWETGEEKIERIKKEKVLKQNETFGTIKIIDLLKIFNINNLKRFDRCYRKIDEDTYFWSPILTLYKNGEKIFSDKNWENILSEDWAEITEKNTKDRRISSFQKNNQKLNLEKEGKRVVFVKYKDSLGNIGRRFIGVFALNKIEEDGKKHYKKIANEFDLSKYYN